MNLSESVVRPTGALSDAARRRILSRRGEPLFLADWERVLMIHFEVDAEALQRAVPFQLDLWNGRGFVSLVAFTMRGMRPRFGGRFGAWLFKPIATHDFLNVRTYVRHGGETGIHFLAEWLSSRLAVKLGPRTFGLPYRFSRIRYRHDWRRGELIGCVEDAKTRADLAYHASVPQDGDFWPCESGSLDEWLMERYTAFNNTGGRKKFFRIWHPPWPQREVGVSVSDDSLLRENFPWSGAARLIGASFSPGLREVWMGRPRAVD